MASIEVQRTDDRTSPSPKVPGVVAANCDLFGHNDLGRFTTYFDQIRMVRFAR